MKLETEDIHIGNAMEFVARAAAAIRAGDAIVDFSSVRRCDSAAVAFALECLRCAHAAGVALRFVALPADLLSLARLYGVEELLPLADPAPPRP